MTNKLSMYDQVTNSIIASVEAGAGPAAMPWHSASGSPMHLPRNATTQADYRGINVLLLWIAAQAGCFRTPLWASYRQWAAAGAQVRGGAKGTRIIFYREFEVTPDVSDTEDNGKRRVAKSYSVFSAEPVDGFDAQVPEQPDNGPIERAAAFDALVAGTKAVIHHGGMRAFYRPSSDEITMPDEHLFHGTATMDRHDSYASTMCHELGHWTGHKSRLDRNFAKRFGTQEAVAEEIVAELTAAFLCAQLGISAEPRVDHAQYIAHYMALIKADGRAIFTAAAAAAKAADYVQACGRAAPWEEPIEEVLQINTGPVACAA